MSTENKTKAQENGQENGVKLVPQLDKPKNKLVAVREQLQANPKVYFAGEVHKHYPDIYGEDAHWFETVDMYVAPTTPQFDAMELNTFMDHLTAGIELSGRHAAQIEFDGGIRLGRLYYEETIGSIREVTQITVETTEPETIERAGLTVGKSQSEFQANISRMTWVKVYPDPILAKTVYEYENNYQNGIETDEQDDDHCDEYAKLWISGKQVQKLKAQYDGR